ncbi:MAG: VWA domain-containing protein [Chlamydiota bacterium]|nr:VWA domain-containing protein [Chlamydiota bacterium]
MIFSNFGHIIWFLLFTPIILILYFKRTMKGRMVYSSIKHFKQIKPSFSLKLRHSTILIRITAIALLTMAMMRPQKGIEETKIETEGIDIMLVIDISGSMMAEDFIVNGERKNRLEAVKNVVRDFIKKRQGDRIGLVVFAGSAYMQCPLTLDYGVLLQFLDRIDIGMIEDGTAIGDGIATALTRLRKLESKSKIIILLTDGVNNAGNVDPNTAADLAKTIAVRVYTIGAGSKGRVPFPARDFFGNKVYQWAVIDLDEQLLTSIAKETNAAYFRATDTKRLGEVYDEINRLEKTKIEINAYMEYRELFIPFIITAMILLLFEILLRQTRFKTIP